MIRGSHLARSIIENKCWEGLDRILDKFLSRGLKEGIKAFLLLKMGPHGISMAKSYGHLEILSVM